MDCVLCSFDKDSHELVFACANNPLWLIRNGELLEFAPDKMPVGIQHGTQAAFSLKKQMLLKGDMVYLLTDGYADQFGGPKGKKFKYKPLKELLISIHKKSLDEQKDLLDKNIEKWKGDLEQVDDICIIGIRL